MPRRISQSCQMFCKCHTGHLLDNFAVSTRNQTYVTEPALKPGLKKNYWFALSILLHISIMVITNQIGCEPPLDTFANDVNSQQIQAVLFLVLIKSCLVIGAKLSSWGQNLDISCLEKRLMAFVFFTRFFLISQRI